MATIVEYIVKFNNSQVIRGVKGMKQQFKGVSNSINRMESNISGLNLAFAGLAIFDVGSKLVKLGSDFEETSSKFATVFKDVSSESEKTASNLEKDFGLSSLASKTLLSDTGDLLTGFGFTGKMALGLSDEVQKLAVDLASFTNFSGGAKGASQALTKALLGERESVKSLGISILDADVKARVKQMEAMGKLVGMTMRQKKAFATLKIAQEQSKNAIGDYARTSGSFANTLRRLQATAENFGVFMGQTLVPMIQPFVNILLKLGEFATRNKEAFQTMVVVLTSLAGTIGLIVGAIKAWVVIQKILNFIVMKNPIILALGLIISAIAFIVHKTEGWVAQWERLKAMSSALGDFISSSFSLMWLQVSDAFTSFLDTFVIGWKKAQNLVGAISDKELIKEKLRVKDAQSVRDAAMKMQIGNMAKAKKAFKDNAVLEIKFKSIKKTAATTKGAFNNDLSGGSPTTDATTPGALTSGVKGKAASVTGAAPKIFNLNVEKLIETLSIKADNVTESTEQIQNIVLKAITGALADVQTIVR